MSNDASNKAVEKYGVGMLTVIPLTINTSTAFPFQTFLPVEVTKLSYDSKAQAEQVRAISTQRLGNELIGSLPLSYLNELDNALRLHLAL